MQSLLSDQYSSCYHCPFKGTGFRGKFPASKEFKPANLTRQLPWPPDRIEPIVYQRTILEFPGCKQVANASIAKPVEGKAITVITVQPKHSTEITLNTFLQCEFIIDALDSTFIPTQVLEIIRSLPGADIVLVKVISENLRNSFLYEPFHI